MANHREFAALCLLCLLIGCVTAQPRDEATPPWLDYTSRGRRAARDRELEAAESYYRAALSLAPSRHDGDRLLLELATVIQLQGRCTDASVLYRDYLERASGEARIRAASNLAACMNNEGQYYDAYVLLLAESDRQDTDDESGAAGGSKEDVAAFYTNAAHLAYRLGMPARAAAHLRAAFAHGRPPEGAMDLADDVFESAGLSVALECYETEVQYLFASGQYRRLEEVLRKALDTKDTLADRDISRLYAMVVNYFVGRTPSLLEFQGRWGTRVGWSDDQVRESHAFGALLRCAFEPAESASVSRMDGPVTGCDFEGLLKHVASNREYAFLARRGLSTIYRKVGDQFIGAGDPKSAISRYSTSLLLNADAWDTHVARLAAAVMSPSTVSEVTLEAWEQSLRGASATFTKEQTVRALAVLGDAWNARSKQPPASSVASLGRRPRGMPKVPPVDPNAFRAISIWSQALDVLGNAQDLHLGRRGPSAATIAVVADERPWRAQLLGSLYERLGNARATDGDERLAWTAWRMSASAYHRLGNVGYRDTVVDRMVNLSVNQQFPRAALIALVSGATSVPEILETARPTMVVVRARSASDTSLAERFQEVLTSRVATIRVPLVGGPTAGDVMFTRSLVTFTIESSKETAGGLESLDVLVSAGQFFLVGPRVPFQVRFEALSIAEELVGAKNVIVDRTVGDTVN